MAKRWKAERPAAVFASLAMALSLAMAPVASARAATGVPEWATDGGGEEAMLTAQASLPKKYDLRSDGLVTPVKSQSPWQSCWAFAGISAAETSMLSAYGLTSAEDPLDLSERHLAWFALHPVTEADDPRQAGEGMHTTDESLHAAYDAGGFPVYITTLFSQGVGPMTESMFPYRGVGEDGNSHLVTPPMTPEEFESDPAKKAVEFIALHDNMSESRVKAWLQSRVAKEGKTYEEVLAETIEMVRSQILVSDYSKEDDWSIPETNEYGYSNRTLTPPAVIKDGNILPKYWDEQDNERTTPNEASINAMKQELVNGHAVSITYKADKASPGETGNSDYMNADTWAQYTSDKLPLSHAVCIVGYDDDYPAENFTHDVYARETNEDGSWKTDANNHFILKEDSNGRYIVDKNSKARTTPPGNGAWIVKNSWGSQTDVMTDDLGNETGRGTYGVRDAEGRATGYFYLSYYDKTISMPETMTFTTSLMAGNNDFEVLQHDYMPAQLQFHTENDPDGDVMSSANVFELTHDIVLRAVSTRTSEENQRVTLAIYLMNDGATDPTDGVMLYRTSRNFEYAGFHRLDLDMPLTVPAGKRLAVVSTASTLDVNGNRIYSVSANQSLGAKMVDYYAERGSQLAAYGTAVVNEGESFFFHDGKWQDWSEHLGEMVVPELDNARLIDYQPIDNFSIKVYAEPATTSGSFWGIAGLG